MGAMSYKVINLVVFSYLCNSIVRGGTAFEDSGKANLLRWADFHGEDMEPLCDRLAIFVKKVGGIHFLGEFIALAPAVLITNDRLITSFNPFRTHMINAPDRNTHPNNPTAKNTPWFGRQREASPVHDLMLFRLKESVPGLPSVPKWSQNDVYEVAGPLYTNIAKPGDVLERDVTFCSLGFNDSTEMERFAHIHSSHYAADDNAVTDCDEWLPREWGHFICIRNVNGYKGIGSGAMLFHNNKLYGVGSFLLNKGKKGVLVFTDVRPYHDLIMKTCTQHDQAAHLYECHHNLKQRP